MCITCLCFSCTDENDEGDVLSQNEKLLISGCWKFEHPTNTYVYVFHKDHTYIRDNSSEPFFIEDKKEFSNPETGTWSLSNETNLTLSPNSKDEYYAIIMGINDTNMTLMYSSGVSFRYEKTEFGNADVLIGKNWEIHYTNLKKLDCTEKYTVLSNGIVYFHWISNGNGQELHHVGMGYWALSYNKQKLVIEGIDDCIYEAFDGSKYFSDNTFFSTKRSISNTDEYFDMYNVNWSIKEIQIDLSNEVEETLSIYNKYLDSAHKNDIYNY